MMVLPTLIVLWAVIVALLTVPAFWKGEQPEPETWAVALHINNDQGWQESVHEALRASSVWSRGRVADMAHTLNHAAGEIIRENVEQVLGWLLDSVEDAEPNLHTGNQTTARRAFEMVRDDIGSLWRVNWDELGAAFLADLD